jgi:hypothetical protein
LTGFFAKSPLSAGTGADGALTVSATFNINTGTNGNGGRVAADGVAFVSTASTAAGASAIVVTATPTGIAAGDEVVILDAGGAAGNYAAVGTYEFQRIASVASKTLNFTSTLANSYDGTTQNIVVQRVPNYSTLTVDSGKTLTADAWNGTSGGLLFIRVAGAATIVGSLTMADTGYRGGALNNCCSCNGYQGESRPGTGAAIHSANDGGGGYDVSAASAGSYGTAGNGGKAGATYGTADLSMIFLGSGGAGSTKNDCTGWTPRTGGTGGGIIYLVAKSINVTGTISADAQDLTYAYPSNVAGAGAGGSIYLSAATISISGTCSAVDPSTGVEVERGGKGRIAIVYTTSLAQTCDPAPSVTRL